MSLPLYTDRLVLRRLVLADADALAAYRSLPEVARYQSWRPATSQEVRALIGQLDALAPLTPGQWFQIGISRRDSNALLGDCAIHASAQEPRQVELGITLAPAAQGQGFAREALGGLLEYLFTQTPTHRVYCSVDPRNLPCLKLLAGVGMRQEAHLRQSLWLHGEWVDDMIFAVLKSEWRGPIYLSSR